MGVVDGARVGCGIVAVGVMGIGVGAGVQVGGNWSAATVAGRGAVVGVCIRERSPFWNISIPNSASVIKMVTNRKPSTPICGVLNTVFLHFGEALSLFTICLVIGVIISA